MCRSSNLSVYLYPGLVLLPCCHSSSAVITHLVSLRSVFKWIMLFASKHKSKRKEEKKKKSDSALLCQIVDIFTGWIHSARSYFKPVVSEEPNACYFLLPVSIDNTRCCWLCFLFSASHSFFLSRCLCLGLPMCALDFMHKLICVSMFVFWPRVCVCATADKLFQDLGIKNRPCEVFKPHRLPPSHTQIQKSHTFKVT